MIEITHPLLRGPGRLYAGGLPERPFGDSVAALAASGITTVACLLELEEFPDGLREAYEQAGFEILCFPVPDFGVPTDPDDFGVFLLDLLARLRRGESLFVHCYAGIGRTGVALCCLFKLLGETGDPIQIVRAVYARSAVESPTQQRFVKRFDARLSQ